MFHRSDVATFFEPSITVIKDAIREQKAAASVPITVSYLMIFSTSHNTLSQRQVRFAGWRLRG